MKRRDFLKTSAGSAIAVTPFLKLACSPAPKKLGKVGLQLWSVRQEMAEDFEGVLAKVAEVGYEQVEFAGYYNRSPQEIKALLDKNNLTAPATHLGYEFLKEDVLEKTIEDAKIMGHEYLIMPSLPREWYPPRRSEDSGEQEGQGEQGAQERQRRQRPPGPVWTVDAVKKVAENFNLIGKGCQKGGLRFAYHNHRNEFVELEEGGIMYDLMLQETDPELVDFEIDLGWAVAGGGDPLAYFEKYPGRFALFHIKDMDEENRSVAVGAGKIDWPAIFSKSGQAGVKYYIVEYEGREDPIASVAASREYLKNLTF